MEQTARRPLHPLVALAAIAVILFCAVGIAAVMGWIPTSRSGTQPSSSEPLSGAPAPAASAVPAAPAPARVATAPAQPAPQRPAVQRTTPSHPAAVPSPAPAPAPVVSAPPAPPVCTSCGTVVRVSEIKQAGEGSGIGAVAGGVAGAVLGNQIGGGRGRDIATVVGAVGGAVAGHQVEKHVKGRVVYRIEVEMDDGAIRTFTQAERPSWRPGDRVRVEGDRLAVHS